MKFRITHLTMLLLAGTTFHAAAQTRPSGPQQNSLLPPPILGSNPMQFMDTDKNGVVSQAEFLQIPMKNFKEKDKNGDGVLSKEELAANKPMNMPPLGLVAPKNGDFNGAPPPLSGKPSTSPQPSQKAQPRS